MTVIAQNAERQPPADDRGGSARSQGESAEGQWSAGTPHSPGALSPIAEGSQEDSSFEDLDSYLLHEDPDLQSILSETRCQLDCVLDDGGCTLAEAAQDEDELDDRLPLSYLSNHEMPTHVYNAQFDYREELYDDEQVLCELAIYPPMCKTVPDAPFVEKDEVLVFQTSAKSATRRVVVQRDDDLLIPDQVKEHWGEVQKARLK